MVVAAGAAGSGPAGATWQCAPTGTASLSPALAESAGNYLRRVEALYPYQLLGLVRAGGRFYLVNSRDIEWAERARLDLLALRLPESFASESQRQGLGATPGGRPPSGDFVCLAPGRSRREGLERTPSGDIRLDAGQSVHLVDPREPQVAVELRAAPDRSLNLGEILLRSARSGIYAGLTGKARQAGGTTTLDRPDGMLIFRVASAAGPGLDAGVSVERVSGESESAAALPTDAVLAAMPATAPPSVAREPAPRAAPTREEKTPAVALAERTQSATPSRERVAAVETRGESEAAPAPMRPKSSASGKIAAVAAAQELPRPQARQPYDEYARAMKTLMALKRPGSVRSVSEMTYVHPAVEVLRRQHP